MQPTLLSRKTVLHKALYLWIGLTLLVGFVSLAGCESAVEPYVGGTPPYTIWGMMDSGADTQRVRVFAITDEPVPDRIAPLDARVQSTDLTTGEVRTWAHKQITFDNGIAGDVFIAPFRALEKHTYRLEVIRSDGEIATTQVTVPQGIDLRFNPHNNSSDIPVVIERKDDATRLVSAEVVYEAFNVPPDRIVTPDLWHPSVDHPVHVSYLDKAEAGASRNGWNFWIYMGEDYDKIYEEYERYCLISKNENSEDADHIGLRYMELRILAADSAWSPPGGVFDLEVLAEPGVFSNVENGYGFFGAGEVTRVRWEAGFTASFRAGFREDKPCRDEGQRGPPPCESSPIPCFEKNRTDFWYR